ncbi:MAG: Undecaprenyl-phosphate 4-deoxy-4-formamido-L-arabinose transferase [Gemmatimonadaceae bacterium]|nr:Undecaprenyl-phosphate 4-deoxy-4-formamido-L-arabinose transferase [Gemmatimonadaceae bacterium]
MLYICIPAFNEAPTIGVLLWRIRRTLEEFAREYELLVYNDGSTDQTDEVLTSYSQVLPLSVLGGKERTGYARAVEALLRSAAQRTRYARRDAIVVLQADFTDLPEGLPELIRRFEGGADIVTTARTPNPLTPAPERRLRRLAPWLLKPFVSIEGVKDPCSTLRLYRVAVVRDSLKAAGSRALTDAEGWAANVDFLLETLPYARRVETVEIAPRYDIRSRTSRIRPLAAALDLYRHARRVRQRKDRPSAPTIAPA